MARKRRPSRAARQAAQDAAIEAQWARIPLISSCKGLCRTTCTQIDMSQREHERILERHGVDIPLIGYGESLINRPAADCPALTMLGRCGVYADRPAICRLWGATVDMPCIYGCEPDTEPLDTITAREILTEVSYVGGLSPLSRYQLDRSPFRTAPTGAQMRELMEEHPERVAAYRQHVANGIAMDTVRAQHVRDRDRGARR